MRKAILWFIGIAAVILVATKTSDIITLADTVRRGSEALLVLAVLLQLARYFFSALSYSEAFKAVGVHEKIRTFIPVVFGAVFMNTIMPSGGTAGPLLLVDDARKRGVDSGVATSAMLLSQVAYFSGFALIMSVGFIILGSAGRLGTTEFLGGAVLLGLIALFASFLVFGKYSPQVLVRFFQAIERLVDKVFKLIKRTPPKPWAEGLVTSFSDASAAIWRDPVGVGRVVGCSFLEHFLDLLTFVAVGWAFGFTDIAAMTAGYVVAILLTIVSIIPQGVGIVEGGIVLLLGSYGVNPSIATAISLVFRGIVFWLPLGVGAVMLRRTKSFAGNKEEELKEGTKRFIGRLAGILATAIGGLTIVLAVAPSKVQLLSDVYPWLPFTQKISATTAVLAGIGLFLVARGLWKRYRTAWGISLGLLVVTSLFLLLIGQSWQSVAMPLLFALWLFTERHIFDQRIRRVTRKHGLYALGVAIVVPIVYGTLGFWALDLNFSLTGGFVDAFKQTIQIITHFVTRGEILATTHEQWFLRSVYVVAFVCIFGALLYILGVIFFQDFREWGRERKTQKDEDGQESGQPDKGDPGSR